jgi:AcrR family transcriptional regulator
MTPATRTLSTAGDRRVQLVEAAMDVFAERGFAGTSTAEVARAAGLSQAYLFKLFPTKGELAVAVVDRCFERTHAAFVMAIEGARGTGQELMPVIGKAYRDLVSDPSTLLVQLHAQAAAVTDPAVREHVRRGFARLYELVARATQASDDELRMFFATGMLINVSLAMDASEVDEPWARAFTFAPPDDC